MKKNSSKMKSNYKPGVIKYANEDTNEIKKFIYILIGVALVALLLYLVSAKYLIKDRFQDKKEETAETISYDNINIGNVFNRPYESYYVLFSNSEDSETSYLNALKENYKKEDKIYNVDLNIAINKKAIGEVGNKTAITPNDLSIVSPTLIKINNGFIAEYYEGIEEIENILK